MTKPEFLTLFGTLLAVDCMKSNPANISRTLTDREAESFAGHLWEQIEAQMPFSDEVWLCQALLRTQGKFDSEQDRAAAILKLKKK